MNRTVILCALSVLIVISGLIVSKSELASASQVTATATFADTWTPIPSRTLPVWTALPTNTPLPPPTLTPSPTLVSLGIRAFNGYEGVFSPNGAFVLTVDRDKSATLWDVQTGHKVQTFRTTAKLITAIISPSGKTVITSDESPSVQTWDAQSGAVYDSIAIPVDKSVITIPADFRERVYNMQFSPSGKYLLLMQGRAGAFQFDFSTDRTTRLISAGRLRGENVASGSYSPDERYLTLSTGQRSVMIDIEANTITRTFGSANSLEYSPDGRFILMSGAEGSSVVWELVSNKEVRTFPGDHARFSPDGRYVLTANPDGTANLWAMQTGTSVYTFKGTGKPINALAFSPDSRYVLISSNGAVWLWDLQTIEGIATEAAR